MHELSHRFEQNVLHPILHRYFIHKDMLVSNTYVLPGESYTWQILLWLILKVNISQMHQGRNKDVSMQWVIPMNLSRHQNWEDWLVNLTSNQRKHKDLRGNPKGKNHGEGEREFHYNSRKITMVITLSHVLGFLGFVDHPPSRWKGSTIYTYGYFLDKITKSGYTWISVLSQLFMLSWTSWFKLTRHTFVFIQGLCLVDMINPLRSCNH